MTWRAWKKYTHSWGEIGQKQADSPAEGSDRAEGMAQPETAGKVTGSCFWLIPALQMSVSS